MKKQVSVGAGLLLFAAATFSASAPSRSQGGDADPGVRDRFVGAWQLVWLEEPGADGNVRRADCTGMFVFTRDGHAAVQVMYRNPGGGAEAGPVQYAQGGYEATFGRYEVDPRARTFTYHVEGGIVRNLIGKDLVRSFELSGERLIVKSSNPSERWRVAWERYR
jgi:Lipocalin-like domain